MLSLEPSCHIDHNWPCCVGRRGEPLSAPSPATGVPRQSIAFVLGRWRWTHTHIVLAGRWRAGGVAQLRWRFNVDPLYATWLTYTIERQYLIDFPRHQPRSIPTVCTHTHMLICLSTDSSALGAKPARSRASDIWLPRTCPAGQQCCQLRPYSVHKRPKPLLCSSC